MIELKNVSKSFQMGEHKLDVLKSIDLSIARGDFVAIMGPSGSGKSTLMNILGLLDVPSHGSYKLGGLEVAQYSEDDLAILRRRKIGFIFQQFNLLPRLEAWQNVSLPLLYSEGKFDFEKASKRLGQVSLSDRKHHKTNEVSGGQQQRIAIARSLMNDPEILFADEPSGNLDEETGDKVMSLLFDLVKKSGTTLVLVTHDPELANSCQRIIHLEHGKLSHEVRK